MAFKRKEVKPTQGNGWIHTFADLMNLLLCFFVLLFSMSSVDADKYQAVVSTMTKGIGSYQNNVVASSGAAVVASGTSQLPTLTDLLRRLESEETKETSNLLIDEKIKQQVLNGLIKEKKDTVRYLYEAVVEKATEKKIIDIVDINVDTQNQYIQLSLKGTVLFDSGMAQVKSDGIGILNKLGEILKYYDKNMIKIEGHTDNVPIQSDRYSNNMELSTARATSVFVYLVENLQLSPDRIEVAGRGEYSPIATNRTVQGRSKNRRIEIKIYTSNM